MYAIHTKNSGDGGIDGIIKRDPLGKCYNPSDKVSRPAIQSFDGSLDDRRASQGVFITTSDYTGEAIKQAKRLGIVLVNGKMLTKFMLKYRVGVQVQDTCHILRIDNDFFD